MKSRITLSPPRRAARLAGLLALGTLALPSVGYPQPTDAERALLNKTDAAFNLAETKGDPVIDGARALLGQPGVSAPQAFRPSANGGPTREDVFRIDGAGALLGRSFAVQAAQTNSALGN